MNTFKKISLLGSFVLLSGCAGTTIHDFINNPAMNAMAPNVTNAAKMFYPERYNADPSRNRVPSEFANTVPDRDGDWVFVGFEGVPYDRNIHQATFYNPKTLKRNGDTVRTQLFFYNNVPQYTASKKMYRSALMVIETNCVNKTEKTISGDAYSGLHMDGTKVSTNVYKDAKPNPFVADSMADRIYQRVCK